MLPEESIVSIKTSAVSAQATIQCKNLHSNDERTLQCPNLLLLSVISTREQPDRNQHSNLWWELPSGFDFYKTLHFSLHQPHRAGSTQSIRTLSSENLKPACSLKITLAYLTNGPWVIGKQPLHSIFVHKNTWLRWNLFFQSAPTRHCQTTSTSTGNINQRDLDGRCWPMSGHH